MNNIFSPKREYKKNFLEIVKQTGGMDAYDEVEKIYLRKGSGEAYFIKKESGSQDNNEEQNCFLIGWKGSLET